MRVSKGCRWRQTILPKSRAYGWDSLFDIYGNMITKFANGSL